MTMVLGGGGLWIRRDEAWLRRRDAMFESMRALSVTKLACWKLLCLLVLAMDRRTYDAVNLRHIVDRWARGPCIAYGRSMTVK